MNLKASTTPNPRSSAESNGRSWDPVCAMIRSRRKSVFKKWDEALALFAAETPRREDLGIYRAP